jgi:hypothetical protein
VKKKKREIESTVRTSDKSKSGEERETKQRAREAI